MKTTSMHIRVNPKVKQEVEPILQDIGLTMSDAFNLLLNQIRIKKAVPFELTSSYYPEHIEKELLADFAETETMIKNGTAKLLSTDEEITRELNHLLNSED